MAWESKRLDVIGSGMGGCLTYTAFSSVHGTGAYANEGVVGPQAGLMQLAKAILNS